MNMLKNPAHEAKCIFGNRNFFIRATKSTVQVSNICHYFQFRAKEPIHSETAMMAEFAQYVGDASLAEEYGKEKFMREFGCNAAAFNKCARKGDNVRLLWNKPISNLVNAIDAAETKELEDFINKSASKA